MSVAKKELLKAGRPTESVILEGDAFDLLANLPDRSVDLIITSPPYWGLRTYGHTHNWEIQKEWLSETINKDSHPSYSWYREHGGLLGLEPLPEWYIGHLVEFFLAAKRVLKTEGSIWINVGDTYFARWSSIRDAGRQGLGENERSRRRVPMGGYRQEKQLLLIPARFAIAMQDKGWILRNDLIWYKPNVPPRPEKDRLKLAHEHFFHFVHKPKQGRAKYYYDKRQVEAQGNDVVSCFVRAGKDNHSATFPSQLITPRILSSSPPQGLVLDPFCGSGSVPAIAKKCERIGIGFELSSRFSDAARRRLDDIES
jgi:DNA modification methylase